MKRLFNFIKGVFNRYESAIQRYTGDRSWLPASVQDARLDIDASTRTELVRRHRYWVKNSVIVNRIRELKIQFAVGVSGLQCVPNSSDETWNESKSHNFEAWSQHPELNSDTPLAQMEQVWEGQLFDDGEYFIHKTWLEVAPNVRVPRIETFEGHRCETPPDRRKEEGKTIIDGVAISATGAKLGYYIRDLTDKNKFTFYKASDIIHKFKVRRPGQMRGIPEGFSGMNTLHDYEDLHMLEMRACKGAAEIMNVITNAAGEISPARMMKSRLSYNSQDANGTAVTKSVPDYLQPTQGANTIALKKGEDIKQFMTSRPSVATQAYWDLKVTEICCGYNVPKLLVMPFSLQGTVTRADLDIATGAFRRDFEIIAATVREIYEWQTNWAVKYDRSLDGKAPADFLKVIIRPPRAPNVDVGRNSAAMLAELKAGTMTYQDIFAERQQDWRLQMRQSAEAAAYLKQLAIEFSVDGIELTPEEIADKLDTGIVQTPADKAPTTQDLLA